MKHRFAVLVALVVALGAIVTGPSPAFSEPTAAKVALKGELVQVADQTGPKTAIVRTVDKQLVPVSSPAVTRLKSGSTVTLDVVVPARVRSAAAAGKALTVRIPSGKTISTPLSPQDLAAAGGGTPAPLTSDLGKATVAYAVSTGEPLAVSQVVSATEPAQSYTRATRHLYVAIVTPKGSSPPNAITNAQIQAQVASTSGYWSTVSAGGVTMDIATITAPYTSAYTCSSPWSLWDEAAAKTEFPAATNTSLVVELPPNVSGCSYGLGTMGGNVNDDGMLYVSDKAFPVLAHELGHNMSLQHANTLECPSATDSAFSGGEWTGSGCNEGEYRDGSDVMAMSTPTYAPFLSTPQSLRTGILADSAATLLSATGTSTVELNALGSLSGNRAAKVVDSANGVTYYVEYRVATAPDTRNVFGEKVGVRVLRFNPATGTTVLLDPTPSATPSSDDDATLHPGATFTSYSGQLHVTTLSTTPTTATVSITNGINPPSAPTGVSATAENARAEVSWTAPESDGGSAITGYRVTASPGGRTATTTGATTASITGLSNGTSYRFTVTATNTAGTSPPSAASAPVIPMAPAGGFTGTTPTRVLDTRYGTGVPQAKIGAAQTVTLTIPDLPDGTTAVALNVAVTKPTAASYLTVYPGGTTRPTTGSNLNFVAAQTIPNMVLVPLGDNDTVTFYNNAGTVDVIADLVGAFTP
jgi:hypothetical protein